MKTFKLLSASNFTSVSILFAVLNTSVAHAEQLDTINITADFRPTSIENSTASVSVVTDEAIDKAGADHAETLLNATPNVNTAGGSSRNRYFQIRGIGERSQFETPINPSVGLFIDGIDLSRSGGGATLFDVDQVEIVRGPQGTRYGANALAGIINIQTAEPTNRSKGKIEVGMGNYGQKSIGVAGGGPLIKNKLLGRISLHSNTSDGYITNTFLNRDDTNGIDELTARGQLKWFAKDDLTVNLKYLHLDINNGYDAFNFDSDRTTQSDEPGKDTQKTDAVSLSSTWNANDKVNVESSLSFSDSDLEYSYDEDWSFEGEFSDDLFPYKSFDQYLRNRKNTSLETRFLSSEEGKIFGGKTDWVTGLYYSDKSEDLTRKYTFLDSDFESTFDTKTLALYGQLDTQLNEKTKLITGARIEKWDADYTDSNDSDISVDETLYGGKLGLEYKLGNNHLTHATLSRGFKAGGVNAAGELSDDEIGFETEYLWNFEVGVNSLLLDGKLNTRLSAFYAKREDQQISDSKVIPRDDGSTSFVGFISNEGRGSNIGLEAELNWQVSDKLQINSSLGLLEAKFDNRLDGRDQAHAPSYQFSLGADYRITPRLTAGVSVQGKDSFFFSDRHNEKAESYEVVNANLSYKRKNVTTTLWGRNLLDEDYDVRGFGSFGNNPGNGYTTERYTQKGEPRVFGINVKVDF